MKPRRRRRKDADPRSSIGGIRSGMVRAIKRLQLMEATKRKPVSLASRYDPELFRTS